jgi:RimJ/RimL family protein N-acetyltransferase
MTQHVELRLVAEDDLPLFFEYQQDEGAALMAGVPSRPRDAFMAHWRRILANPTVVARTILADGVVVGNIVSFVAGGQREVGYWLDRRVWGQGVATAALRLFIADVERRPLRAHVMKHNTGSRRVLERCGFVLVGEDDEAYAFAQRPAEDKAPA